MGKRDQHRGSGGGPRPTGVQPADATPRHSIHLVGVPVYLLGGALRRDAQS